VMPAHSWAGITRFTPPTPAAIMRCVRWASIAARRAAIS
jgi:hypothetical protein